MRFLVEFEKSQENCSKMSGKTFQFDLWQPCLCKIMKTTQIEKK